MVLPGSRALGKERLPSKEFHVVRDCECHSHRICSHLHGAVKPHVG